MSNPTPCLWNMRWDCPNNGLALEGIRTVSDETPALPYPAIELLRRACENPRGWKRGVPRWSAVGEMFSMGSGYSIQLCRAVGVDPNTIKGKP